MTALKTEQIIPLIQKILIPFQNNSGSSSSKSDGTNDSSTKRGYSDTPQGYMTDVENANYLTNFTSEKSYTSSDVTANDNFSNNSDITNNKNSNILNSTNNKKINIFDKSSDDNYIENLKGNNGSKSYSELLGISKYFNQY